MNRRSSPGSLRLAAAGGQLDRRREAPERLLNVGEAAAMLGVKPATLYQWAYQRRLPVVKLFGPHGALRFRQSDIERLIRASLRPALRTSNPGDSS